MIAYRQLTMDDYLKILRRRIWMIIVPAVVICVATFLVCLKIPNRYTSQTLVLVEEQRVPDSIVKTTVTGELNARLASMQEQILSRTRLQPIVERFGLFNDDLTMEDRVNDLRKVILVTPVRPMAETRADQLPGFYITVTLNDARVAQQICSNLTSMFMEENLHNRQQQAQSTTDFLAKQLADAKQRLDEQDEKFAAFKQAHAGEMPDEEQTNLNLLMSLNTQLEGVNQALTRAQQDKSIEETLLAQVLQASKEPGKEVSKDLVSRAALNQQLQQLQTEQLELETIYTDGHPDVIKKKAEIDQLKKRIAEADSSTDPSGTAEADSLKTVDIDALGVSNGDASKNNVLDITPKTAPADSKADNRPSDPTASKVTSPQLQRLRMELYLTDQMIREKTKQDEELRAKIRNYEARVRVTPLVEEQFKQLTRNYQTALEFYNDLLKKQDASAMATDLERRQQGETFEVLDPASLPEKPSFPNRRLFVGGGFAGGLGFGIALTLVLEFRDKSLRSEEDVTFFLKLPTIAMVPVMRSDGDRANLLRRLLHVGKKAPAPVVEANA
jgi:uncharacterized protein involved in exopolysaccharide biosynthesis